MPAKPAHQGIPMGTRVLSSLGLLLAGLGLAYAPLPGLQRQIRVVSGTELQESLQAIVPAFNRQYPEISVVLDFQGSQDLVSRFLDNRTATALPDILIPADGQYLQEIRERWRSQNQTDPFIQDPSPVAKTSLVAVAWPERGQQLFRKGKFDWSQIEKAMQGRTWATVGGDVAWGSFDFILTDPTRSNSGLLTLALWSQSQVGNLNTTSLGSPKIAGLFQLIRKSVYEPPRSTDILLKEFITRGPNEADVGITYESIALDRWKQSASVQQKPYQIYYLDKTVETTPTAAIVNHAGGDRDAAKRFLEFLTQAPGQTILAQHGFRPGNSQISLDSIADTPWKQPVPGAMIKPISQIVSPPNPQVLGEIQRQWERAQ